jgi:hypothetical protein
MAKKRSRPARGGLNKTKIKIGPAVKTGTDAIHEYARVHNKVGNWITKTTMAVARGGTFNPKTGKVETKAQKQSKTAAQQRKDASRAKRDKALIDAKNKVSASDARRQILLDDLKEFPGDVGNLGDLESKTNTELKNIQKYWADRRNAYDTLKETNPQALDRLIKERKDVTIWNQEADRSLHVEIGDPNTSYEQRRGTRGFLDTEEPYKFNPNERSSILGLSGTDVRSGNKDRGVGPMETDRSGSRQQRQASKWNAGVRAAAKELAKTTSKPFGVGPDDMWSDVDMPPQYANETIDGVGPNGKLSRRDLWIAERTLDYGHIGTATHPGFHYVMNYDSNGQPEFTRWNRETNASMTPTEHVVADQRIKSGEGYKWDSTNKARFESYLDEVLGVLPDDVWDDLGLDSVFTYYDDLETSPFHMDDPQRNFVNKNGTNLPDGNIPSAYYLTNDNNNFTLDNYTRKTNVEARRAQIVARLAFLRTLPSVDFDTLVQQGFLAQNAKQFRDIDPQASAAKAMLLTDEELIALKKASLGVLSEGQDLTVDQVLRRAVGRIGKTPISLAAISGTMGKAFADAPADEETLTTVMNGLQMYDDLGPGKGRDMWVQGLKSVGLDGARQYIDKSFDDGINRMAGVGDRGGYGKADAAVLNFIKESVVDLITEPFGWIQSGSEWLNNYNEDSRTSSGVMQTPIEAQVHASMQNNVNEQPSIFDVPDWHPPMKVEPPEQVNQGLLKNNWT